MSEKAKEELRRAGFYVRMTEWFDGFQVCAFQKIDLRNKHVSGWYAKESDAWWEVRENLRNRGFLPDAVPPQEERCQRITDTSDFDDQCGSYRVPGTEYCKRHQVTK